MPLRVIGYDGAEYWAQLLNDQKGEIRTMCDVLDRVENKGRIEGRAEGRAEGKVEGTAEGKNQMAVLMKKLFAQNRLEDAKRAVEDATYCDALMKQYGIC